MSLSVDIVLNMIIAEAQYLTNAYSYLPENCFKATAYQLRHYYTDEHIYLNILGGNVSVLASGHARGVI